MPAATGRPAKATMRMKMRSTTTCMQPMQAQCHEDVAQQNSEMWRWQVRTQSYGTPVAGASVTLPSRCSQCRSLRWSLHMHNAWLLDSP